ncbi:hypothetical protein D3C81_1963930 [compost metagenome]
MVSASANRMSSKYGCRCALPRSNIGRFSASTIWMRRPSWVISNRICSLKRLSVGFSSTLFCSSCSSSSRRSRSTCSASPSAWSELMRMSGVGLMRISLVSGCAWTCGLRVLSGAGVGVPPRSIT